jgi:hypothetical protein
VERKPEKKLEAHAQMGASDAPMDAQYSLPQTMNYTTREQILHRIGFLEGQIEGITLYAIWNNGEQWVGCTARPLSEVLAPYRDELQRMRVDYEKLQTSPGSVSQ